MKTDPRFAAYDRHPHTAFNSRMEDLLAGRPIFILHITGKGGMKPRNYVRAQAYLRRGPSLLPNAEAERWNLAQPQRIAERLGKRIRFALLGR
jgi:hypothetical protein